MENTKLPDDINLNPGWKKWILYYFESIFTLMIVLIIGFFTYFPAFGYFSDYMYGVCRDEAINCQKYYNLAYGIGILFGITLLWIWSKITKNLKNNIKKDNND